MLHRCVPINSEDMKEVKANPLSAQAFMCNYQSHWIAIRQLYGTWYHLNSLSKHPTPLSDTYLGMYIQQLESEQYTVFVVQGDLPPPSDPALNQWVSQRQAKYWTPEEIQVAQSGGGGGGGAPVAVAEDPELAEVVHRIQEASQNYRVVRVCACLLQALDGGLR